jgi:hypothetical protein
MVDRRGVNLGIVLPINLFLFFYLILLETPCTLSAEKSDLRDIKGPITGSHDFFLIVAIVFLLIFLTGALFYALLRKKKNLRLPSPLPHEVAYEALQTLGRREFIKQGKVQEYYVELSNIIRRYLEHRFSCHISEMTTEECFLTIQDKKEFSSERRMLLKDFLSHCDLVKFAGYIPSSEEMERSLKEGQKIIDQTKEKAVLP